MPILLGSTCHWSARRRTRANAAFESASWGASAAVASPRAGGVDARPAPANIAAMDCPNAPRSAGVWISRYFKTNAATPLAASARATSEPSFSIESERNPPPGATIAAAPVAFPESGRYGVNVATVTFRANALSYCRYQLSCVVAPGRDPVPRGIASCWGGVEMGVIAAFCACAGVESAHDTAIATAASTALAFTRLTSDLPHFPAGLFAGEPFRQMPVSEPKGTSGAWR